LFFEGADERSRKNPHLIRLEEDTPGSHFSFFTLSSCPKESQCSNPVNDPTQPIATIQKAMLDKHLPLIDEAGKKGVQILCLQELLRSLFPGGAGS
jgi:hypothetical protein